MARILCLLGNVPGILFPGVELSRRLRLAGHEILCATFAENRKLVEHHGFQYVEIAPNRYADFVAADSQVSMVSRLRDWQQRRTRALASLAVANLAETLRDLELDLLMIDGEMHEHIIASSAAKVPIVVLNCFSSIWQQPGLPPPHCQVRPGVGWRGTRLGMWMQWRVLRLSKTRRAWLQRLRNIGCDRLSLLRALADSSGFDFRGEIDRDQWLIPFTYRHLPALSLHALAFEFPHCPPEHVHYVGPLVLEDRADHARSVEAQARLEALFEKRRVTQRKLLFAAFGSYFTTDLDFLRRLLDAVAERPDWDLVVSLGGRINPRALGDLPTNVHAFSWLPQLQVLQHADAAITHGGINTIDECVLANVPMLVYCGHETDMAGNTARVEHHGIGLVGDQQCDSPDVIRQRLERLLEDREFSLNLDTFRKHFETSRENRLAEHAVETLLADVHGSTP